MNQEIKTNEITINAEANPIGIIAKDILDPNEAKNEQEEYLTEIWMRRARMQCFVG